MKIHNRRQNGISRSPRPMHDGSMRHRNDLRGRNNERIDYHRPGFLIPEPDAAWVECFILDLSEAGIRLDVGALGAVPEIFGVALAEKFAVISAVPRPESSSGRHSILRRESTRQNHRHTLR
jgi:hypothetical protein